MELTQDQFNQLKQKGLSDSDIRRIAAQKGFSLPKEPGGIVTDFTKGVVKGALGDIARPTAQALQGLGQRAIAAATPMSLEQVRRNTGLKSLDDSTPEGQSVVQSLKTDSGAEVAGRVGANIASFFIPVSPAAQVAGRATKLGGGTLFKSAFDITSKEAPLIQAYRAKHSVGQRVLAALGDDALPGKVVTNAETALRHSLWGTESMVGIKALKASRSIWDNLIGKTLKEAKEVVDMPSFINEIREQVRLVPELSRRAELDQALMAFADDYKNAGKVTYEQLQRFKEGWAKFQPDKRWKGKPVADSFREVQEMAASLARNKIYQLFPDDIGKVAYLDYSNLYNLKELGQKAMTQSRLKGGSGTFVSAIKDMVVTPIATTGGLTLYKAGQGLEFVGASGAKVLSQIFK